MPQPPYARGKKNRHTLDRRLRGSKSRSGRYREIKILDLSGARTPTTVVQPVASRYTECAKVALYND
jgi:hypothetical protein